MSISLTPSASYIRLYASCMLCICGFDVAICICVCARVTSSDLVRINCNRLIYISNGSGLWLSAFGCFLLTGLAIMGFFYWVELAQAFFFLAFPMSLIGLLNVSTARRLHAGHSAGEELHKLLNRHGMFTKIIGMVSILVTALWGMFWNIRDLILLH